MILFIILFAAAQESPSPWPICSKATHYIKQRSTTGPENQQLPTETQWLRFDNNSLQEAMTIQLLEESKLTYDLLLSHKHTHLLSVLTEEQYY